MILPFKIDIVSLPIICDSRKRDSTIEAYPIICGIYKITSPTGASYIGLSTDIYYRIHGCYKLLTCYQQHRIFYSLKKYGVENHTFEIIDILERNEMSKKEIIEELNKLEIYYIEKYNTFSGKNPEFGLNLTTGGNQMQLTQEARDRINKSKIGRKQSEETIKKRSESLKGRKGHPKSIAAMTKANTGIERSPEYRQKLRDINLGKKQSEETKLKKSNAMKGKKSSEETKEKLSQSKKGSKNPNYGKNTSDETKLKISLSLKKSLANKKNNGK